MTKDEEILEARRNLHEARIQSMLYKFKVLDAQMDIEKFERLVEQLLKASK